MLPRDSLHLLKPWGLCRAEPQAFCASPVPLCSTSVSAGSGVVVSQLGHVEETSGSGPWAADLFGGCFRVPRCWEVPGTGQHCPKEPNSARKVRMARERDTRRNCFCSNQWGRALADPCPAFPGKHPCVHSSRGAICPELNSPLETDERLQRV